MGKKRSYFISDLHLGATYDESSRRRERLAVDFLRRIKDDAERLYLVGDVLDYWFEYKTVVPRGYVRFFGALAELADAGVRITWFIGNHDIWLFDYLRDELGIEVVDGFRIDSIKGNNFYISHGDAIGKLKPGFRFIRALFRNRFCQKLYSGIHPRWTIPFALKWSSHSRKLGCTSDGELVAGKLTVDDSYLEFARETLKNNPDINFFVFGHRHIMMDEKVGKDCRVIILGDWLTHFSYGVYDGEHFLLETLYGDSGFALEK